MNDFEKLLQDRFPHLLTDPFRAIPPSGWEKVVLTFFEELDKLVDGGPSPILVGYIKEKYASLCIRGREPKTEKPYWNESGGRKRGEDLRVVKLIGQARKAAEQTCQECGEPGEWAGIDDDDMTGHWDYILCPRHKAEQENGPFVTPLISRLDRAIELLREGMQAMEYLSLSEGRRKTSVWKARVRRFLDEEA
jgi:hypothetical protein